jgi:hypothetical protein
MREPLEPCICAWSGRGRWAKTLSGGRAGTPLGATTCRWRRDDGNGGECGRPGLGPLGKIIWVLLGTFPRSVEVVGAMHRALLGPPARLGGASRTPTRALSDELP